MESFNKEDYAYGVWICLNDDNSCEACKKMNDHYYLLNDNTLIPYKACTCKNGCRCTYILTPKGEKHTDRIIELLKENGGKLELSVVHNYMEKIIKEENRPRVEYSEALNQNINNISVALSLEKNKPIESIELYRKTIGLLIKLSTSEYADNFIWSHICYCYNRMTLVLEKNKRVDEALKEIMAFEGIDIDKYCNKSDLVAISKRKVRLHKLLNIQ
jgi:hypothetical protein